MAKQQFTFRCPDDILAALQKRAWEPPWYGDRSAVVVDALRAYFGLSAPQGAPATTAILVRPDVLADLWQRQDETTEALRALTERLATVENFQTKLSDDVGQRQTVPVPATSDDVGHGPTETTPPPRARGRKAARRTQASDTQVGQTDTGPTQPPSDR